MELIRNIDETFSFETKEIRVTGSYNEPKFVAKDICDILELKNVTEAIRNIPERWRTSEILKCANGQNMNMITLFEPAVYQLIMRSNKPMAKKFQEYVCEVILPTIRKTGEFKLKQLLEEKENEKQQILEEKNRIEEEKLKLERKFIKEPKKTIEGKNVVYLMTTDEGEKIGEYVVGKAFDISNRKDSYNSNKLHDFKIKYFISCKSVKIMDIFESLILNCLGQYRCKAGRDVFLLPEEKDISLFTEWFDFVSKKFDFWEDETVSYATVSKYHTKEKVKEKRKNTYIEQKDKILKSRRDFYQDNKIIFQKLNKIYCRENREKVAEENKRNYEKHRDSRLQYGTQYYYEHKDEILEKRKVEYKEKREEIIEKVKEYYDKNYETKIKPQRQKLELCECGNIVTHYQMNAHKKRDEHKQLLKIKENLEEYNKSVPIIRQKGICICGMIMNITSITNHMKKDTHKKAMKLREEYNKHVENNIERETI